MDGCLNRRVDRNSEQKAKFKVHIRFRNGDKENGSREGEETFD